MLTLKNRRNIQSVKGDGHFGDTFDAGMKKCIWNGKSCKSWSVC